jgi:pimeloyl-ACP methyl ester carboxylesterase
MNRRTAIATAFAASALIGKTSAQMASPRTRAHIVMIHGAWHGGWCWSRLSPLLSNAGLNVSPVTLTGCGERRHLLSRSITLDTHVQDVVQHIEAEEFGTVTLLAHSYGGFVASGVAEALGNRIGQLILLDAFAPRDGETVLDYAGPQRKADVIAAVERNPEFDLAPIPAAALGITDPDDAAWVTRRMTAQPVGTYLQPIRLTRGIEPIGNKVYLACDKTRLPVFDDTKRRIGADAAWRYKSLDAGHDAMIIAPALLAEAIVEAAG